MTRCLLPKLIGAATMSFADTAQAIGAS